ncbi:SCP2 sterol-binding domain-containing protein [Portibacter marinus]|uniref:SCP2 sterol-binding domain-containing protein n=1 Tax=Portibacter marinus TaxID=2898660 RepID=UPI001F21A1CF|nr:SCP2 sterol-binding domain-containing protein [Portibacter marinus]
MTAKEFLMDLPDKVAPEAIEGVNTRFHFILDAPDGQNITVGIENGEAFSKEGLEGEPTCVVKAKSDNMLKILKGDMNPMMAVLTGKLKISNQSEMMKYAKLFGLM